MVDALQKTIATTLNQVVFSYDSGKGAVPFIVFDCSMQETHKQKSTATKFETENAQTISDHMVIEPFALKLTALISNTPLVSIFGGASAVLTAAGSSFAPNPAVLKNNAAVLAALPLIPTLSQVARNAYQSLLTLQQARVPFQVTTTLRTYENMWMENLSVPRTSKDGGGIICEIDLIQLLLVSSSSQNLSILSDPNVAASKTEKGPQNGDSEFVKRFDSAQQSLLSHSPPVN
jgi:hypothetical protein